MRERCQDRCQVRTRIRGTNQIDFLCGVENEQEIFSALLGVTVGIVDTEINVTSRLQDNHALSISVHIKEVLSEPFESGKVKPLGIWREFFDLALEILDFDK